MGKGGSANPPNPPRHRIQRAEQAFLVVEPDEKCPLGAIDRGTRASVAVDEQQGTVIVGGAELGHQLLCRALVEATAAEQPLA